MTTPSRRSAQGSHGGGTCVQGGLAYHQHDLDTTTVPIREVNWNRTLAGGVAGFVLGGIVGYFLGFHLLPQSWFHPMYSLRGTDAHHVAVLTPLGLTWTGWQIAILLGAALLIGFVWAWIVGNRSRTTTNIEQLTSNVTRTNRPA